MSAVSELFRFGVMDKPRSDAPCRYFQQGYCMRGTRCWYRHEHEETSLSAAQPQQSSSVRTTPAPAPSQPEPMTNAQNNVINTDVIDRKIKHLQRNMPPLQCEYYADKLKPLLQDFYAPLKLDYVPITILSAADRITRATELKQSANELYSSRKFLDAIACYKQAIVLLDCTHFQQLSTQPGSADEHHHYDQDIKDLLFVVLSNSAQCWLSYSESVKEETNILYLLYALNCCQMSLWLNSDIGTNCKAMYRKTICCFKLGLFECGDELVKHIDKSANNESASKNRKMLDLMIRKLEGERILAANQERRKLIGVYSQLMHKLGPDSEFEELTEIDSVVAKYGYNWQHLLLAVAELVRAGKWSLSSCMSWLKRTICSIVDSYQYDCERLLPPGLFAKDQSSFSESDKFRCYCLSVVVVTLSVEPQEIAKYFSDFIESNGHDQWEDSCVIKFMTMNGNLWMCEIFWSSFVEQIFQHKWESDDYKSTIRKETLNYVKTEHDDKKHLKWKQYHDQIVVLCKSDDAYFSLLPADGRQSKLPDADRESRIASKRSHDDLFYIHAAGTAMNHRVVVEEIEQTNTFMMSGRSFTWLHHFAEYGRFNVCEFLIASGMVVNVTDYVSTSSIYGRRRQHPAQYTPMDCIVRKLMFDGINCRIMKSMHIPLSKSRKHNMIICALLLRKLGGKRLCELEKKQGDKKENGIFCRIMNLSLDGNGNGGDDSDRKNRRFHGRYQFSIDDDGKFHSDDDDKLGYGGIPEDMCDELLCQGIKPWDDDAMGALSVLYDFD